MMFSDIKTEKINKLKLKIAFSNNDRVKRSPFYLCNNICNKLSIERIRCNNIFEFKKHLRKSNLSDKDKLLRLV